MRNKVLGLCLICLAYVISVNAESSQEQDFVKSQEGDWRLVIDEPMSNFNSTDWVFDGLEGHLYVTEQGLRVTSGPEVYVDAHHTVLWNKQLLHENVMLEYDYTRLDESKAGSVNIIYLLAQGSGISPYEKDIMQWNHLRTVPAMRVYFDNMCTYHISYAVTRCPDEEIQKDYIRGRLYNPTAGKGLKGTDLVPEYEDVCLFKKDITYKILVLLRDNRMYMQVEGDNKKRLFYFDINPETRLKQGYLGFRQMWGRSALYANLKVWELRD